MYTSIPHKEEHESSSSSSSTTHDDIEGLLTSEPQARFLSNSSPNKLLYVLLPIASILSIVLGVFLNQVFFPVPSPDANKICPPHIQHYSPVLKEVDTKMHIEHFNGSFLYLNAFRGDAGPETDAAWESMGVNCEFLPVGWYDHPLTILQIAESKSLTKKVSNLASEKTTSKSTRNTVEGSPLTWRVYIIFTASTSCARPYTSITTTTRRKEKGLSRTKTISSRPMSHTVWISSGNNWCVCQTLDYWDKFGGIRSIPQHCKSHLKKLDFYIDANSPY